MSLRKPFIVLLLSAALSSPLSAQSGSGQTDSVVTLMNAKLLEQYEDEEGMQFRKAIDARFLHNNTYLICDTAFWNVSRRLINAIGHVQIIQDRTVLSSDNLDYVIDDNLAQFRGSQVQLLDKEGNTLRTRFLDYNTKDSIAVFRRGGSMRDKDGQVIESTEGTYDSKEKLFTFNRNVNMYTDSVYIKTNRLLYHTDYDFAEFFGGLDAWKGHNMMSSEDGSYDKAHDRFFFTIDVHMMSDTQEGWADSLYFDRTRNDLEMYGNVQVMDTTRNVSALSERLFYVDTLSQVTLERNATVVARTDQGGQIDTVYMAADRMVYHTVPKCDIDGNIVEMAGKRLADLSVDAVSSYRARATSAAPESGDGGQEDISEEEEEEEEDLPDISANAADAPVDSLQIDVNTLSPMEGADSLGVAEPVPVDSVALAEKARMDSLAARELFIADSLKNRDTTAIGFLTATGHIRVFKSDMQARCDSLEYSDLDSLARLFISPIVWNEGNRQYTSDSLTVAIKNQRMDKASLMSDAFIIIQEDSICFDQIKGTEILAYFDSTTALERFDALGGSQALFYLRENDAFATVNKVEARMISANFVDGEIDRIYYFENPKNDAYPVVQLPPEEKEMKGFNWQPETRPKGKQDITALELRKSERITYLARPMPRFDETNTYFPGHMKSIAKKLAEADSLRRVRHAEARERQALAELEAAQDSLLASVPADTLAVPKDSLGMTVSPKDSLEARLGQPGPGQPSDSLATIIAGIEPVTPGEPERELTPEEQRAAKKAETEAKRQARVDAREARWAELDARDAAKAAAKEAKALEKKRKATLRAVLAAEKEAARDQKRLEKYIRKYEKQKARREARKGARKDAPGDAQSKDTLEETL